MRFRQRRFRVAAKRGRSLQIALSRNRRLWAAVEALETPDAPDARPHTVPDGGSDGHHNSDPVSIGRQSSAIAVERRFCTFVTNGDKSFAIGGH